MPFDIGRQNGPDVAPVRPAVPAAAGVCTGTGEHCLPGAHVHPRRSPELAFPVDDAGRYTGRPAPSWQPAERTVRRQAQAERERDEGTVTRFEVRAWALAEGHHVSAAGRLPQAVVEEWNREHPGRLFEENQNNTKAGCEGCGHAVHRRGPCSRIVSVSSRCGCTE